MRLQYDRPQITASALENLLASRPTFFYSANAPMNHPPKNENDDLHQQSASSSSPSTNDKLRAFAEAREKANAQSRELGPSLGSHLVVIVAGLVVIAIWAVYIALKASP